MGTEKVITDQGMGVIILMGDRNHNKKGLNIKREYDLEPHCETVLVNSKCPYIILGCTGCLIANPYEKPFKAFLRKHTT